MNQQRNSVQDVAHDTSPQHSSPSSSSPLLNLPMELFLKIWEDLPTYSRICLILTSRQLFVTHHHEDLEHINSDTPAARIQRLFLLRRLRKDSHTLRSKFLCHNCIKFHPPPSSIPQSAENHPSEDHESARDTVWKARDTTLNTLKLPDSGFPYCNSSYTLALQNAQSRIASRTDRGPAYYDGSSCIKSTGNTLYLYYKVTIDADRWGKYIRTLYSYDTGVFPGKVNPNATPHPAEVAQFLRSTNLEVCPHMWFGEDFAPGDASVNDTLEVTAEIEDKCWFFHHVSCPVDSRCTWPEFSCRICRVSVWVEARGLVGLRIWVKRVFETPDEWGDGERPPRLERVERRMRYNPRIVREERGAFRVPWISVGRFLARKAREWS